MDEQWRRDLRAARHNAGLTLDQLAELCGLSYEAVRGYENGRRRPTRKSLRKVLEALELPAIDAARIIERAGFVVDPEIFAIAPPPAYQFSPDELQAAVSRYPWPVYAVDDVLHMLAVNRAAERLWGYSFAADRRKPTAERRSFWDVAAERGFASKIRNLEEVVRVASARYKGGFRGGLSFSRPSPRVEVVLNALNVGEPNRRKRMADIFARARPLPPKIRWDYDIEWDEPSVGLMRFR